MSLLVTRPFEAAPAHPQLPSKAPPCAWRTPVCKPLKTKGFVRLVKSGKDDFAQGGPLGIDTGTPARGSYSGGERQGSALNTT